MEGATMRAIPSRGFFGIGIENHKTPMNLGTLWRSAYIFDAAFIFTVHRRYPKQASDTVKAWRHVPLLNFDDFDAFWAGLPFDCPVVGLEQDARARDLEQFTHPERAVYLLGAEDHGLSKEARQRCHQLVQVPSRLCLNVAVAGSIVMWHRQQQRAVGMAA